MRAAEHYFAPDCYPSAPVGELAHIIDTHAIAPAVAERDAVIGHLLQWCHDLRGEWQWKKDEPRAGNQADYEALCATIEAAEKLLTKGGAHE